MPRIDKQRIAEIRERLHGITPGEDGSIPLSRYLEWQEHEREDVADLLDEVERCWAELDSIPRIDADSWDPSKVASPEEIERRREHACRFVAQVQRPKGSR